MATKKQATSRKTATSASAWKGGRQGMPLTLPSGNVAKVRAPGMQEFLRLGFIPQPLLGLVREGISGKGVKEDDIADNLSDSIKTEEDLQELLTLFDRVLCHVVVEPPVRMQYFTTQDVNYGLCGDERVGEFIPFDERDDELLYADDVDQTDKEFIFQFAVGGTRDLEQFRQQQGSMLDAVSPGEGMDVPTE